ncbi:GNAT family N-acetyltransferase [Microbacterium stercoris]|uniref:GNAT family N-acetyltransferase n=1 Tax=Microbacterium stercoris TaxID=2820289 RepID=A0A939TT84_9MICO|nr:GNAT family N-acetyltransferase [Microbacterium stercoris]MBO3662714.1 GNAT family N-acetyltransferase [Microbacterium stercoris]
MEIERADDTDVPELARMLRLMHHRVSTPDAADPAPDELEPFAADLREWWHGPGAGHAAFVARVDGAVVGAAWVALLPRVPRPGTLTRVSGDIQSVFVHPAHRGRRIASGLVRAALDHAQRHGAARATVHATSRAIPVYERLGFATSPALTQREG